MIFCSGLNCDNLGFGIYIGTQIINAPNDNWNIIISAGEDTTACQLLVPLFDMYIHKRFRAAGQWGGWETLNGHT